MDGDLAGDALDEAEIDAAVGLGRRGNGDEDDFRSGDGIADRGGEGEASGGDVLFDEVFEAGFIDGDLAILEGVDFFEIVIDADDGVTDFSEAGACD